MSSLRESTNDVKNC